MKDTILAQTLNVIRNANLEELGINIDTIGRLVIADKYSDKLYIDVYKDKNDNHRVQLYFDKPEDDDAQFDVSMSDFGELLRMLGKLVNVAKMDTLP